MTKTETQKIIAVMMSVYPTYKPVSVEIAVDMWTKMLAQYPYEQVSSALENYIATDTSGFAPSIGAIIQRIERKNDIGMPNELEAWGIVTYAMTPDWGKRKKNFKNLPEIIQKSIGGYDLFADICDGRQNRESVCNAFMRCYRDEVKKVKENGNVQKLTALLEYNPKN